MLLTITVLGAGCGDGAADDGAPIAPGAGEGGGAAAGDGPPDPAAAEPPGTSPAEVVPHVEALLTDHGTVVSRILADPGVAADPDAPLVRDYAALYEPGSAEVDGRLRHWAGMGEAGVTVVPVTDRLPVDRVRLDGDLTTVSAGEVRFPVCHAQSREVRDGDGQVTQRIRYRELPGRGTAVRIDGVWRLRRLEVAAEGDCAPEGGG